METIIQVAQFILSLSLLIVLHEGGHFLPAKLFKTRVEKFYLFFDYKWSIFKKKIGDTEYGIGWIPLGGYVKISGMIDESMDKEQMAEEPKEWEFRSKTTWQRLIIMVGGVVVNVIVAVLIYAMMLFAWGDKNLPMSEVNKNGIYVIDSLGLEIGLENGDKVLAIDHDPIENYHHIMLDIIMNEAVSLQIERNGEAMNIEIPYSFNKEMIRRRKGGLFMPRTEFVIDSVLVGQAAHGAGILKGDKIVGFSYNVMIEGDEVNKAVSFDYYDEYVDLARGLRGTVTYNVIRDGSELAITTVLSDEGKVGVYPDLDYGIEYEVLEYGFFASFPAGVIKGYNTLHMYVMQMGLMFSKKSEGYKHIGGFDSMRKIFAKTWDWKVFWDRTAMLSIILAFMNILPIPALDGGHVLFLLYEMIFRRKPSDKFLEYAQVTGFVILMSLMVYANGNDVYKGIMGMLNPS